MSQVPKGEELEGVPGGLISQIWHTSLQGTDHSKKFDPKDQMPGGWSATFAIHVGSFVNFVLPKLRRSQLDHDR